MTWEDRFIDVPKGYSLDSAREIGISRDLGNGFIPELVRTDQFVPS